MGSGRHWWTCDRPLQPALHLLRRATWAVRAEIEILGKIEENQ
jgi:hypothetical protein